MGNELNEIAKPADSGCNKLCVGNGAETCGGPDRMNLYHFAPASTDPTTDPSACTIVAKPAWSLGCQLRGFQPMTGQGGLVQVIEYRDVSGGAPLVATSRADCASKCSEARATNGDDACRSVMYSMADGSCYLLATDAWGAVDGAPSHGSLYQDYVLDDWGCFECAVPQGQVATST